MQIEEKKSTLLPIFFGVPQDSILGSMIFNICVAELADCMSLTSIQYTDDTTIYRHCKIVELNTCIDKIE